MNRGEEQAGWVRPACNQVGKNSTYCLGNQMRLVYEGSHGKSNDYFGEGSIPVCGQKTVPAPFVEHSGKEREKLTDQ